jgi:flagellar protein FlaG
MEISSVQAGKQMPLLSITQPAQSPEIQQERREIVRAVKKVNQAEFYGNRNELQIAVDQSTRRSIVKLVDKETKEVVRQIPPEYVLRLAEELESLA